MKILRGARLAILLAVLASFFMPSSTYLYAQAYGEGSYNSCTYDDCPATPTAPATDSGTSTTNGGTSTDDTGGDTTDSDNTDDNSSTDEEEQTPDDGTTKERYEPSQVAAEEGEEEDSGGPPWLLFLAFFVGIALFASLIYGIIRKRKAKNTQPYQS